MLGHSILKCYACHEDVSWFYGHLLTMSKMIAADEGPLCRVCCEPMVLFEQIAD